MKASFAIYRHIDAYKSFSRIYAEFINGGDIWAHNEKTGDNELRPVTAVAPRHRDKLLELRLEGEKDALRATPVHPFYARRNASDSAHWIEAGELPRW